MVFMNMNMNVNMTYVMVYMDMNMMVLDGAYDMESGATCTRAPLACQGCVRTSLAGGGAHMHTRRDGCAADGW